MSTVNLRRGLVILLVVVLAGCSSTPASPTSGAATPTPSPTGSTAPATPVPSADLAVAIAPVPRAAADPADAKRAAASINAFGVDVLRGLLADSALDLRNKNVVFSPTSIQIALAMARAGAKGETATEMDRVLHSEGWDDLAAGLNALDLALASRDAKWAQFEGAPVNELTLRMANASFVQRGWAIEQSYLEAIASAFGSGLRLVDFVGDVDAARDTINGWVSDRTAARIPKLLSPAELTSDTRFTLVNAIYLKAQWATPFLEDLTQPAAFTRLDGSAVNVPMMKRQGLQELPYARGDGWQATELRYLGPYLCDGLPCRPDSPGPNFPSPPLAMLLVLPDDLSRFEAGLTAEKLDTITAAVTEERETLLENIDCPSGFVDAQPGGCYRYSLDLFMPRFSVGTRAEMNETLKALGMPLAFDPGGADFSGINPQERPFISFVIHQANIDVDEKGTEAAAATAVGGDVAGPGVRPAKDITMRLDKPYLFFVRDVETGAILFMGRVTDPSVPRGT
jgi:serpin B